MIRGFAEAVRAADPRVHYRRRVIEAVLGLLAGIGLLLAGVVVDVIPVAAAGFVVMLACGMWAVTSHRRMTARTAGPPRSRTGARATGGMLPGAGGLASRQDRG